MERAKAGCSIRCFRITEVIFVAGFFGCGLFMEYAACIFAGLMGLGWLVLLRKEKETLLFINPGSILVFVTALFYLLTAVWGVDAGMSLIGALRFSGVVLFAGLAMQLSDSQREKLLLSVPASAGIMTVSGIAALPFSRLRRFFWTAGRLGGFFQYPNTFALFCLLGFFIVLRHGKKEGETFGAARVLCCQLLLLSGILLSGSRSVFFLLAGSLPVIAAVDQGQRKRMAVLLFLSCSAGAGYAVISGNMQNIGRFLTASFTSSTLLGRVIYVQDALKMIVKNPFGYGYLGYSFAVPRFQSAVYSVRFVHNDILQLALPAALRRTLLCVLLVGSGAALYTGAAMVPRYLGYPAVSAAALPFYAEANREILAQEKSTEKAVRLAERVLRQNVCIPEAYDIRAAAAYQNQQYGKLLANKKKSLLLKRYDLSAYKRYIALLSRAAQEAAYAEEEEETVRALLKGILEAEEILKETKEGTNPLAYQTRDVPELELGEEAEEYIQNVKQILGMSDIR